MSKRSIVLKGRKYSDKCIGMVRLTPQAEKVVRSLREKTDLSICQIVSEIIVQAEDFIDIVGPDES